MDRMPVQSMPSGPLGAAGLSSLSSLQYAAKNPAKQRQNLAKVCSEVEGVFLNQLLQQMRQTFVNSADPRRKRTEFYPTLRPTGGPDPGCGGRYRPGPPPL